MKRYYYYKDQDGIKCRVILTFEETTEENCTICNSIRNFTQGQYLEDIPKSAIIQAKGSWKRHLATGKHWKKISEEHSKV